MARADPVAAVGRAAATLARRPHAVLAAWAPAALAVLAGDLASERLPQATIPLLALVTVVRVAAWGLVAAAVLRVRPPGPLRLLATGAFLFLAFLLSPLLLFAPVYWLLYAPAALADGQPLGRALAASRAFARERKTYGFTALVALAWLAIVIVTTYGIVPLLARATGTPLADALATWLVGPIVPLLPAAYWALAKEAGTARAADAAPSVERATACPRCGTLVPRTTRVRCPACGFEGDVL